MSPNEIEEGNIGFGMLNREKGAYSAFLYAPSVKTGLQTIELDSLERFSKWDYAIGDEKVDLKLNETYLLAAYRLSSGNSIRTYNIQDKADLEKMISEDHTVLLLKIEIEERE